MKNSDVKPKVFISYSWDSDEHKEKVKSLVATNLKNNDIEVLVDTNYPLTPHGGWTSWMKKAVQKSDFVIIIWTEDYYKKYEGNVPTEVGHGVKWESRLIMTNIHTYADVSKYINVVFDEKSHSFVAPEIDCSRFKIENLSNVEDLAQRIKDAWTPPLKKSSNSLSLNISDNATEKFKIYFNTLSIDVKYLKKVALQYLPINYLKKLPEDINSLIDELLAIGSLGDSTTVPIISTFREINNISFHSEIAEWIEYLKKDKFTHITSFTHNKTINMSEVSLLIMFSTNNDTYNVTIWQHSIDGCIKDPYSGKEVDFNDRSGLTCFFNSLSVYIDTELEDRYGENINIEIILPQEKIFENIKLIREISNDILVNKFKIIFRIESRFKLQAQTWKNKWIKIHKNSENLLNSESITITEEKYNKEMSNADTSVIVKSEISNYNLLLNDVLGYGIPIVLSGISKSLTDSFINEVVDKIKIIDCKDLVTEYIMKNRHNDNSKLFLIYDDPDKVPEDFKKPINALYNF